MPASQNSAVILSDIDHSRSRLRYYTELKARSGYEKSKSVSKWIDIYTERLGKLERQASRLGLKTMIKTGAAEKSAASAQAS